MAYPNAYRAIHQYSQVRTQGGVEHASPHQLTAMLFDGALSRIASARGHMDRNEIAPKGECVSKAIDIIEGLRTSLDHQRGGELATNLEALYDYMVRRLMQANAQNDPRGLDEVSNLLRQIKDAWDAIPAEQRQAATDAA